MILLAELPEPLQKRIHVEESEDRLQIAIRWKLQRLGWLVCFGIPAAILFWCVYTPPDKSMIAVGFLMSAALCWVDLSFILNRTTIVKQGRSISVRHHPMFWRGVMVDNVRKLSVVETERRSTENFVAITSRAYAKTNDGKMQDLGLHHFEHEVMRWLESRLNRS